LRLIRFGFFLIMAHLLITAPVQAHPHVWVTARALILFNAQGQVTGFRHIWTFDDMYSAFQIQGLGTGDKLPTRAQLAPLAQTNMESLAEFGYFTFAKIGGKQLEFAPPQNAHLDVGADKLVTLTYDLPLNTPMSARPALSLQVYDPEFFVQFDFAENDPVELEGAPPGCSNSATKPKPLEAEETKNSPRLFYQSVTGEQFWHQTRHPRPHCLPVRESCVVKYGVYYFFS